MTENNVVETESTRKGTTKIDVSWQVKDELHHIKKTEGHLTMDGTIRARFTIADLKHMDEVRNNDRA